MDIDKLFLSGLNYKTEGIENIYGYVEQHLVKESELTEEHQLQNKIIDMYLALLIDKKDDGGPRNVQILHRSIDNDTDLAKSVLKDIEGSGKSKTETPYSFYSLARQTASKNDYITGKVGIGPFALNNNNQILTMIYHISFRESKSSLLSTLGLSRLDKQLDVDGNSIMSWISAMINAHVDIAKDPWISRLNVNPFSYNITNLLLRTGWGGNTFYFLTQPIMKQMADAYVKASSQYMQQNGSTYSRQQQSIKDVAEQYFGKDVTFDGNTLDDALSLIDAGDKESIQAINEAIKKLLESEQFKQDARDYAQGNDVADQKGLKSRQLGIYLAYVQFSKYANALANLVKYCKIDTKKHGKSAAEQLVYKEGFDELFEFVTDEDGVLIKKGDVGALFEPAGLLDLVEHSYVGTKTRNAISLTKVILGGQFMSSTTGFIQMLRQLNIMAGNTSLSVSFVQSAQKALSAAIKSEFFNDYASRISDNPRYMHDLVNSSSEDLEFSYDASTNSMSITGNKHSLKSYVGQPILLWYKDKDGNLQQYIPRDKNGNALPLKVLTAKDDKIQLNISINGNFNGVCRLLGGANTIFDRLSRLKPMIYHNNDYSDLQGNLLLEMLIPGKRVEYSPKDAVLGERPDTYDDLKFVKLQNFVDDGGINTNYIINAWNELLEYQNDKQPQVAEYIRDFARDLIVYAFITSGDTQGFTKMFKYVPASWRKKSGYADFINRKLVQLNSIPTIDLNDVLLNNWYDNKLVPTYQFYSKDANGKRSSNFIGVAKMKIINGNKQTQSAYPTILAALKKNDEGMYEPSIAVESSPKFIKIPRSYNHYDSQRQYNVYQLYGFARHDSGIMYPVYVLVQPKGTKVSGGFMVTEYGRDDSTPSSTEYVVNQGALRDFVESADFINQLPAIKKNFGDEYAAILNGLRTEQTGGVAAAITDDDQAQTQTSMSVTSSTAQADDKPVNIYFKSEENAELSNFARRPFSFTPKDFYFGDDAREHQFYSVEQAFQYYKIMVLESIADSLNYSVSTGAQEAARKGKSVNRNILLKRAQEILNTLSAEVARVLGKKSLGLQGISSQFGTIASAKEIEKSIFKVWDERSSKIMKALIKASFEQNPQAAQRLLDTGNATLTHTQDGSKWKTEFPRLLMEVRDELRKSQSTTQPQTSTPTRTDSSEKSVTEQLVQHLKDSGFTVYDINGNVDENNFETEGVQFFQKKHYLNNTYKSKLNSFKQAILSNKYTQAGVDFLKVDDLYILFEHASHSETIDSIEKGSAGFGLIDVFDSEDNIDYAEISRLMSINYQYTHDEQYILNSIKRAGIRITDNIRNQVNSAFYKPSVQFAIEPISTETDDYEQRLQTILDEAPRDSEGRLLAPNGKPSNLPERLYAQVRTKEFKDWFGDWQNDPKNASKVVDENGEPRIVYHGSNQYGFDIFDPSHSDDKISLFASSSKWIASTYTNFQPLENTLVRKALLKGNAIDLIKNEDWKSLEKLINSVIDSTLPRPEKYGFPLPYGGSKKALDEVLAIQKELDNPNLTEEERYSLLADLTKAEDKYYYSGNYTFKVKKEGLSHGKTRIKISIDDSYSKRLSSFYTEEGVIFRGSPEELIESLTFETKVYDLFFNIKNPLILDNQFNEYGHANNWNNLDFSPAAKDVQNTNFWGEKIPGTHKQTKTRDVAAYAKKNNYDGVIFKRIADRGGYEGYKSLDPITDQDKLYADMHVGEDSFNSTNKLESDIIIAFNSNQVKSAGGENTTYSRTNNNIHFFKDSKGVVYGYVDNHGNIHFDKNKIRPEHPIHEYTHIWDRVVALKNPSLWIRGVELMKQFNGGKLWNEIANSEFYGKKWSNMSDAQREFMIASEVHARLVGEGGAKLISEIEAKQGSSDIISKLKDWILKFWQSLKQTFSNWSKEDIEALTLKDFNHMTLRDFVTSNAEVAYNESDAPLSTAEKLRLVGLVKHDYEGDINVDEEVQRAIDKLNAISPNEQRYITPVITGKSVINGVSLIDAINIAAKIYNSKNILGTISNKSLREKIQQIDDEQLRERLYNISDLSVPNEVMFMIADYISYNDARGIVANYICDFLENVDDDTPYDDIAVPIIESIDVKYDDSRQQSLFSDDIMKHCKGN